MSRARTRTTFFQALVNANICVVGPPGVGKADLGKTLSDATGRTHLSVGILLREEAKKETERAQAISEAILMGGLVASVGINLLRLVLVSRDMLRGPMVESKPAKSKVKNGASGEGRRSGRGSFKPSPPLSSIHFPTGLPPCPIHHLLLTQTVSFFLFSSLFPSGRVNILSLVFAECRKIMCTRKDDVANASRE